MFRGNMRESIERIVVVPDVSVAVFLKVLEYLCLDAFVLDDLDDTIKEELCVLVDMYLLEGLCLLLCCGHKKCSQEDFLIEREKWTKL